MAWVMLCSAATVRCICCAASNWVSSDGNGQGKHVAQLTAGGISRRSPRQIHRHYTYDASAILGTTEHLGA